MITHFEDLSLQNLFVKNELLRLERFFYLQNTGDKEGSFHVYQNNGDRARKNTPFLHVSVKSGEIYVSSSIVANGDTKAFDKSLIRKIYDVHLAKEKEYALDPIRNRKRITEENVSLIVEELLNAKTPDKKALERLNNLIQDDIFIKD
ncbi:hypothetical protein ACFYKX_25570 [Cytobacillus sp. FJAT-54145]|uniref:IDEAL domain-containing protein n=1 Tax=Cytobacillus spartinae TaxID=3299023 RepID=A0ABW6KIF8_9BACI